MSDSTGSVLSLAAQIVAAHVANNRVDPADLPKLINDVHRTLANVGQSTAAPPRAEPAVDIKRSARNDHIVCLECGKHFSMLKRHLNTDHQLTPQEYRQKWGLPPTYPIVAPDYAKTRSALAKKIGLGRKAASRKKAGRNSARSPQLANAAARKGRLSSIL
jgi:predicted transcriptional regulator